MSLRSLCAEIAKSAPSQALQEALWAVPAIQTVHILALSVVLACMGMFTFRLLGINGRSHSLVSVSRFYVLPTWGALLVLLASGSLLILAEPARELLNPAFRWKMVLLVIALVVLSLVNVRIKRGGDEALAPVPRRTAALVLLSLWIAIAFLGRWIAYVEVPK